MGVSLPTVDERMSAFNELSQPTAEGKQRRAKLREAIQGTAHEFHGLGVEMNHAYTLEEDAVYLKDEQGEKKPEWPADPILHHLVTSYPGHRLPHAWLNTRKPSKQISTLDLAGHGVFVVLTGIGGEKWKDAAKTVSQKLGLDEKGLGMRGYSIGWCQDYEDVYGDWEGRREVGEDGCILVRPDRFVAWRSMGMVEGDVEGKLEEVMKVVLRR